jgi:hypothetical protein
VSVLPSTKLPPRILVPVVLIGLSLVLAWPALGLISFGIGGRLWLAIVPLLLIAGGFSFGAARALACRQQNTIEVSVGSFVVFETRIERDRVTSVYRHVDTWFKGVRIDLDDGGLIKIPAHVHRQGKLLAVFEKYGYPIKRK